MTQRTEARFKVFNRSNTTVFSTFIYDNIDFNAGGTYDTSTYEYTVDNAGTYLMGHSFEKKTVFNNNRYHGGSDVRLTRGGTTYTKCRTKLNQTVNGTTISNLFMYKFEVGDKLKIVTNGGQPRMNNGGYGGNDIRNSWWGIKLNY